MLAACHLLKKPSACAGANNLSTSAVLSQREGQEASSICSVDSLATLWPLLGMLTTLASLSTSTVGLVRPLSRPSALLESLIFTLNWGYGWLLSRMLPQTESRL